MKAINVDSEPQGHQHRRPGQTQRKWTSKSRYTLSIKSKVAHTRKRIKTGVIASFNGIEMQMSAVKRGILTFRGRSHTQ